MRGLPLDAGSRPPGGSASLPAAPGTPREHDALGRAHRAEPGADSPWGRSLPRPGAHSLVPDAASSPPGRSLVPDAASPPRGAAHRGAHPCPGGAAHARAQPYPGRSLISGRSFPSPGPKESGADAALPGWGRGLPGAVPLPRERSPIPGRSLIPGRRLPSIRERSLLFPGRRPPSIPGAASRRGAASSPAAQSIQRRRGAPGWRPEAVRSAASLPGRPGPQPLRTPVPQEPHAPLGLPTCRERLYKRGHGGGCPPAVSEPPPASPQPRGPLLSACRAGARTARPPGGCGARAVAWRGPERAPVRGPKRPLPQPPPPQPPPQPPPPPSAPAPPPPLPPPAARARARARGRETPRRRTCARTPHQTELIAAGGLRETGSASRGGERGARAGTPGSVCYDLDAQARSNRPVFLGALCVQCEIGVPGLRRGSTFPCGTLVRSDASSNDRT